MMRRIAPFALIAALVFATAARAPRNETVTSNGSWTFAYDGATGVSTATQTESNGDVSARVTCQAPAGDMLIADPVLGRGLRGSPTVQFRIGQEIVNAQSQSDRRTLTVRLPRRPPNLGAYAHLSTEPVFLTVNGRTHAFAREAVQKIALVANSCWPIGN